MNAAKQSYSRFSKNSKKGAHDHVPSVYEHSHRVKLSIKSANQIKYSVFTSFLVSGVYVL